MDPVSAALDGSVFSDCSLSLRRLPHLKASQIKTLTCPATRPSGPPVRRTISGRDFPPSAEYAPDHFPPGSAARKGNVY
jgi:hypothetical protein